MLGGKPNRENPPLRMGHFAVRGGVLERPDAERLLGLLRAPPPDIEAIGWTRTRQKHASLHAGECSSSRLVVGTESGPLVWRPSVDGRLLDAVSTLRRAARIDDIASGDYPPHVITRLGALWQPAESVVALYRPSLHLDLALHLVRRPTTDMEIPPMPHMPVHQTAAEILLRLSDGSSYRRSDPITYWSSLLIRRMAAATEQETLQGAVGILMEKLRMDPINSSVREAMVTVRSMPDEDADEVLAVLRTYPRQVVAICRILKDES